MKNSIISKNNVICALICALSLSIGSNANAIELEQMSVRGGSLGIGAEVGFEILPTFVVRAIGQKYDYDHNESVDGIDYNGTLGLGSYGLQADFHPPLIPLYLTAGVYKNDNKMDMSATPTSNKNIGGVDYTPQQIGTLYADTKFDKTALYGGLGLEFQLGPVALVAEGGIFYQGEPKVSMYSKGGTLSNNSTFNANLITESKSVADELDKAKYWPALTIMGRWKF